MVIPCISFVGRSGVGKTTVIEPVVAHLTQRGQRVAVVKHTRHVGVETDLQGKDTRRFWDAGATQTFLVTPDSVTHIARVVEPSVAATVAGIRDVDVILVEGDKFGPLPKIEVLRTACTTEPLEGLVGRIAMVSDGPGQVEGWPHFALADSAGLADYIQAWITAAQARVGDWEELEHTADLALGVWAPDGPGLFSAAAQGMAALTAVATQAPLTRVATIALEAVDRESLLVDWLNELLYLSESGGEQFAYLAFRFEVLTETTLRAVAMGARVTEVRNAVKAATFHDLAIRATEMGLETTLVFDM
ncbi:MAG: molybdopterin-guanine dinucleotide biosynthesis protein B [Anaerolineae bacterium]|nr:molybdopterin-guanine dinucleotide biosynthesis protein B [Anaerolineae bacterium]